MINLRADVFQKSLHKTKVLPVLMERVEELGLHRAAANADGYVTSKQSS